MEAQLRKHLLWFFVLARLDNPRAFLLDKHTLIIFERRKVLLNRRLRILCIVSSFLKGYGNGLIDILQLISF